MGDRRPAAEHVTAVSVPPETGDTANDTVTGDRERALLTVRQTWGPAAGEAGPWETLVCAPGRVSLQKEQHLRDTAWETQVRNRGHRACARGSRHHEAKDTHAI